MSGLGGLNKSKHGVVVGLVQLQLPVVETPAQLAAQTQRICDLVGKARRNQGSMDLVVFPEYALHGLSMSTAPELMVSLDGPEVAAFKQACVDHRIWGCFSIMEANPGGNPYNSADHRRHRRHPPLLPQAAPLGAGGTLGARQPGRAGVRRSQWQQALAHHLPRRHVP
ncbi:Formamidase [Hydrogenophaga sp. T4]|nr:Formamidase [Hydrogenophaga sp. T4]